MGKKRKRRRQSAAPASSSPASPPVAAPPADPPTPPTAGGRRGVLLGGIGLVVIAGLVVLGRGGNPASSAPDTAWPAPRAGSPDPAVTVDDFVGAERCGDCHEAQYASWSASTHGRAGGPPGPDVLIAAFDGRPIRFADGTVTPRVNPDGDYVFRIVQPGLPDTEYRVDGVIGGGHMVGGGTQGFVSEFPDGTMRFLPFDFIRREGVWFCNTASRMNTGWVRIRPDMRLADCGDWPPTRVLGTEPRFSNCQQCHGSQIALTFDTAAQRYATHVESYRINCESCHGPGRRHVELAAGGNLGASTDIGIQTFATVDKDSSLTVCFQCHALKGTIEPDYLPGKSLDRHYALKLPMLGENPFFVDGRIRTFAYQQNHLYSDCYLNGSMTCTDCHDPHGANYRDVFGNPLASRFANEQCTSCHASKAADLSAHTRHPVSSPGSQCVSCHMPYLQHPELGNDLRFARSDHTIPIPRPRFDEQLGIDNACSQCHTEMSVTELEEQTRTWYGELKPHKDLVRGLIAATESTLTRVEAAHRLLRPGARHPMAQIAALNTFIGTWLSPNMASLEPEVQDVLQRLAAEPDLDVQSVALAALHYARGLAPDVRGFLGDRLRSTGEMDAEIRGRWSVVLGSLADEFRLAGNPVQAAVVYRKALEVTPAHPRVLLNLGIALNESGDFPNAVRFFERSLRSDPNQPMVHVNLGVAYEGQGRSDEAAESHRRAIALNPTEPLAHFNLGNYHLRRNEFPEAIEAYRAALTYDPGLGRGHYYLARAYVQSSQFDRALFAIRRAVEFEPENANARALLEQLEAALGR